MSYAPAIDVRPSTILFATDFSQASEKPLRHALVIARHYGSKLYLTHVVSSMGFTLNGPEAVEAATSAVWRDARILETDLIASGALTGIRHDIIIRRGRIWEQLQTVIDLEHVDLVVVGTHGRRGFRKAVLGSVAEEVFRHAPCPVLTVGPSASENSPVENPVPRPILFATDFSESSLNALAYAVSFSNERRVPLILLHVVNSVPMPPGSRWYMASDILRLRENSRSEKLEQLRILVPRTQLLCKPEFAVRFGAPAEEILRAAAELAVDGVVLSVNRAGYPGVAAHANWKTAYEVVCRATCGVLTVRS
jgi:nucleotide-binding universal stress UspA family protein